MKMSCRSRRAIKTHTCPYYKTQQTKSSINAVSTIEQENAPSELKKKTKINLSQAVSLGRDAIGRKIQNLQKRKKKRNNRVDHPKVPTTKHWDLNHPK